MAAQSKRADGGSDALAQDRGGASMAKAQATGHVRVIARKGGDVFYAKLKIPRPDGTVYEPQRRLGRVWSKRTRPPAGYLTRSMADARLEAILAGDDPLVNV